jgi:putative ABC transport system substrate-binding protein
MRRRQLISAFAIASASPLVAAQAPARVHRIGVLALVNWEQRLVALRRELANLGYVEGRNLSIEFRDANGRVEVLGALAEELVRLKVDVIVPAITPAALAAKRATGSIPIVVWAAADIVGNGLVASLARPGGNVTGISAQVAETSAKCLEILREIKPTLRRIGLLLNVLDPFHKLYQETLQRAAPTLGLEFLPAPVRGEAEFEAVHSGWAKSRIDAVLVQPSLPLSRAADMGLKHRLPTVSSGTEFAARGGLMNYSIDDAELAQRAASLIDRVLKGAKPADLPVEQPARFVLKLNRKTARALGIAIPASVLVRADEVIE